MSETYLDYIQVKEHGNGSTNFVFQAMHFETHALEDYFGP